MWRPTIWKETLHKISQELIVALYFSKKNCITIDSQVRSIFRWDSNSGINEWLIVSDFVDSYRIYRACELVLSVDYTHVSLVLVLQLNPCFWNDNFSCFLAVSITCPFMGSSAFLRLLLSIGLLVFLVVLELPPALDLGLGLPLPH